jgi:ABC-type branched-subunit amino acid transport system ATPase component
VIGPNGAGKTTLIDAITGYVRPQHGRVALGGVDLGAKPQELPYGRRRMVAIARAVATDPAVLLLDEPAAGLDDTETAELSTLIRQLADRRGIGVMLVEHDMSLVMGVCDRIVVLNFGAVLGAGTPDEIRAHPEVIAAYLGQGVAQMLAVGRALSRSPKVLLADELSLGLASLVVERLLDAVRQAARERGVGVLLVEQHVAEVLRYADRVYVMRRGRVEISGQPTELAGRLSDIEDSYLGRSGPRGPDR